MTIVVIMLVIIKNEGMSIVQVLILIDDYFIIV